MPRERGEGSLNATTGEGSLNAERETTGDHADLFLLTVDHRVVKSKNGVTTFVFNARDKDAVIEYLKNLKPGIKQPRGDSIRPGSGKYNIKALGKPPKGFINGWDGRKTSFPPARSSARFACQSVCTHRKGSSKQTHIIRIDPCKIEATLRELDVGDICLLSYEAGKDKHTCSLDRLHLVPVSQSEKRWLINMMLKYSTTEIYENFIVPSLEQSEQRLEVPTRVGTLSVSDLNALAKRWGLDCQIRAGSSDLKALREVLYKPKTKRRKQIAHVDTC